MDHRALLLRLGLLGTLCFFAPWPARAVISDGMNAENILGQLDDSDGPVWTTNVPNYRPSAQGFNLPQDIAVDTATHRLFVEDFNNHRVLEFDLDSSNNLVDHTADHVLGQTDFTGFQNHTTQNGMNLPTGLAFDPGGQRLFVSDYSNHRVLVFNVASLSDGQNATNVLGQANFTTGSAATQRNRMNLPNKLRYDSTNSRLYVPDSVNNRVLVFDASSGTIASGQNAIFVLGQPNFTSATANTTINGMNNPSAVELSTSAQKLYVSDYNNNRVLVYDTSSVSNGMNASYVIGQSTFNTAVSATSQNGFKNPYGLAYDPTANRLFVAEAVNHRVTVFDVTASTNNPTAVNVLGQANYTTGTAAATQSRMNNPRGLAFDVGNNRLFVSDGNHRIVYHNVSSIVNGQNATDGLGLQDGSGAYSWNQAFINAPPNARGFQYPYSVVLDTSSHRLFVSDLYNNRVVEFNLDVNDQFLDRVADHVLGQGTFYNAVPSTGPARMSSPTGLAYDATNRRLFVGDSNNNRVLIFDLISGLSDGQNAVHVLGQSNFTNSGTGTAQNRMNGPRGLTYDSVNARLYVADTTNNRVLVFNVSTSTLADGQNAAYVLGQPDFATVTAGLTQNKMSAPRCSALDNETQRLFVTDYGNNRVLTYDVSALANNLPAINVLGQQDFTTGGTAATRNGMSGPNGITHDPVSGRLFVSDNSNHRILVFGTTNLTNGQNAVNVLGQANFTSNASGTVQNRVSSPVLSVIDSAHHRLLIPDYGNHRLVTYLVDLAPSTSTLSAVPGSNSGEVALSWPSAGDEESRGALTGNYRIQYATYTAAWSASVSPTNVTTLTIPATNVAPGVVQSTTAAGLTGGVTYSFALFTQDDEGNWSGVSNTTTSKPLDLFAPSTSTLAAHAGSSPGGITLSWASAGHDGSVGVLTGNYRIQYATFPAVWNAGVPPADVTTLTLATATVTPGTLRSYQVTVPTPQIAWYFALFTQDDENNWSDVSNTTSIVLSPPDPPATTTLTSRTETAVWGGWDYSIGASSYTFIISTASANPPDAVEGSSITTALSGAVASLTPNTTYFGFVQACNFAGCSSYTAIGSTVTFANPPVALSTTALSSLSAALDWDANGNPAGTTYEIEHATDTGGPYSFFLSTTGVNTPVPGLSPGTTACFRVLARSWDNVPTAPSNELCVVPPFTAPGVGTLTASGAVSAVGVWGSASGATSYTLRLSTMPDNPPVSVAGSSTTAGLTATIAGLTPNTTYYGFSQACNGAGCSDNRGLGLAVTEANPATGLSTTTLTSLTATLAWNANSNPDGTMFRLERATQTGGPYTLELATTSLTDVVGALSPGVTACFRVIAQSHAGVDASPTTDLCFIPPYTGPGAGSLTATGINTVVGTWGSASGATSYTLRVSTLPDNPPTAIAGTNTTAGLTATIAGLTPNTTYYGFVTGCNVIDCGENTPLGLAITQAAVPVNLSTTSFSAVSVDLSFDVNNNPPGTSFEIQSSTDGGTFVPSLFTIDNTPALSGLTGGLTYSFRVRAINHAGVASGFSNTVSVPTAGSPPASPVNLRGTAGPSGITYSWNPVTTDAAGLPLMVGAAVNYEISAADDPAGPFSVIAVTTAPTHGLVATSSSRYFRLRAEAFSLYSPNTAVIDNSGEGRYVFPGSVGTVAVLPQGLLTGVGHPRHVVALAARPADDALVSLDVAVVDAVSGASAGVVSFSPPAEVTTALPGVTSGERPVEILSGSTWLLAGTAHVGPPNVARFDIKRASPYRVKGAGTGGVVQGVVSRVFTPNGDGRNDATVVRVDNPGGLSIHGEIYDTDGVHIADMAPGPAAGLSLMWDGKDSRGESVMGGVYIYQVTVGDRRATGSVVVSK